MKQQQIHNRQIILMLNRIVKELQRVVTQLEIDEKEKDNKLPRCKNCGIRNVRVRIDKSYFCRNCGYDTQIKSKAKGSKQ